MRPSGAANISSRDLRVGYLFLVVLVHVSAKLLKFPHRCACCGGVPDTEFTAAAVRVTGKRVIRTDKRTWGIPYCSACVAHVRLLPGPWGCLTWLLALLTCGLWLVVQLVLDEGTRARARAMCSPNCACPNWAAEYRGWDGSIQSFEFTSADYARAFALANHKSLINVSPGLRGLLEAAVEEEQRAREVQRLNEAAASEEALVTATLADVEKARGPASRRAALERGLSRVTRVDLRERLLLEAARIETRAVLEKVDSLKSKAAKRRHIEDGLAALRSDAVADELQVREIAVLEAALRELGD
ncbi:hypothetical protein OV203_19935 [Nannocystis sp. ILAH1]|uniref:hypothetical protein n=1 Tax=unclassified Nannocystis TaxID=2627009 RepID=UPI0022711B92|nr:MULTISPECIES: hypothetical protein [unclassified Nannocystis]MCY0989421.1 hypothetical protein [Nannocystis sp. ILAH1]MCY1064884.1 hypothetical protein [Nannocystis sp. RBIL2]